MAIWAACDAHCALMVTQFQALDVRKSQNISKCASSSWKNARASSIGNPSAESGWWLNPTERSRNDGTSNGGESGVPGEFTKRLPQCMSRQNPFLFLGFSCVSCLSWFPISAHTVSERFRAVPDDFASAMTQPDICSWFDGLSEPRKARNTRKAYTKNNRPLEYENRRRFRWQRQLTLARPTPVGRNCPPT